MKNSLYEKVIDRRDQPIGPKNWIGNLRWLATENKTPLSYTFLSIPNTADEVDMNNSGKNLKGGIIGSRTLFSLSVSGVGDIDQYLYRPDCLEVSGKAFDYSLHFPIEKYGAIVKLTSSDSFVTFESSRLASRISSEPAKIDLDINADTITLKDGRYTIVFKHNGSTEAGQDGETFSIFPDADSELLVAISFHIDRDRSLLDAETLFTDSDGQIAASCCWWESYLQSCPIAKYDEDYKYFNAHLDKEVVFTKEQILTRQLWHWSQVVLCVSQIEFNDYTTYMAPDKAIWFGTWSNDGPESLCALACTNAAPLVRECLINYIRASINDDGVLSWYTHGFGQGCYGRVGDSGRYSHGVPNIVHTVDYYIRQTGDKSVLDEPIKGNITLWDKLKQYITKVFELRDCNGDGLIEWNNLWETGWDDKSGPFFSKTARKKEVGPDSTVAKWVEVVTTGTEQDYESFHQENSYPVTALAEQCFLLWSLKSMANMCDLKEASDLKEFCQNRYENIVNVIRERHWNEKTGFYHDWDIRNECLADSKSLDAFYFMFFEKDSARLLTLLEHFNNQDEFNLMCPPTLSKDSNDFNPEGYWCGGHWPRESTYLGLAFNKAGFTQKAEETVLKALCSAKGKVLPENINPLTGVDTTKITSMAYNSLFAAVLLEINNEDFTVFFE